jgi:hypothetical protein
MGVLSDAPLRARKTRALVWVVGAAMKARSGWAVVVIAHG